MAAPTPAELLQTPEALAELQSRLSAYPLDRNDLTRERLHLLTSFYSSMHDACFDKCSSNNDLTFLSIQEGRCFRNCLTKVSYYYPTIKTNL